MTKKQKVVKEKPPVSLKPWQTGIIVLLFVGGLFFTPVGTFGRNLFLFIAVAICLAVVFKAMNEKKALAAR